MGGFLRAGGDPPQHPGTFFGFAGRDRPPPGDAVLPRQLAEHRSRHTGAQGRRLGLNENYARELLELHTLGVDGGYSQSDVTELARVFTGWGLCPAQRIASSGAFASMQAVTTPETRCCSG